MEFSQKNTTTLDNTWTWNGIENASNFAPHREFPSADEFLFLMILHLFDYQNQ